MDRDTKKVIDKLLYRIGLLETAAREARSALMWRENAIQDHDMQLLKLKGQVVILKSSLKKQGKVNLELIDRIDDKEDVVNWKKRLPTSLAREKYNKILTWFA